MTYYKKALVDNDHIGQQFVRYDGPTYMVGISRYDNGTFWLYTYLRGDAPNYTPNLFIREARRCVSERVEIETTSYGSISVEDAKLFCRQMEEAVSAAEFIQKAFLEPLREGTFVFGEAVSA